MNGRYFRFRLTEESTANLQTLAGNTAVLQTVYGLRQRPDTRAAERKDYKPIRLVGCHHARKDWRHGSKFLCKQKALLENPESFLVPFCVERQDWHAERNPIFSSSKGIKRKYGQFSALGRDPVGCKSKSENTLEDTCELLRIAESGNQQGIGFPCFSLWPALYAHRGFGRPGQRISAVRSKQ